MTAQDSTSGKRNRFRRAAAFLAPAFIVLAVGAAWYGLQDGSGASGRSAVTDAAHSGARVVSGQDYYLMVKLVELGPNNPQGGQWDSLDGSGPDITVYVYWRGQRVYRSTTVADSFVARWSPAEIDLRKIALSGQATSVESVINAARINIAPGEEVRIAVYDADLFSPDDSAGELIIPTTELLQGEQTYRDPSPAIKRIVIKTVSMDASPEMFK